jgi:hypothetical protein
MWKDWGGLLVGLLCALAVNSASAQSSVRDGILSDENVKKQVSLALANFGRALCENDRPCVPATPAELANPPISVDEARIVIRQGMASGAAQSCGLDWQERSFLPMMSYWRRTKQKTERQMALIGLLHGIAQGQTHRVMAQDPCSPDLRGRLDAQLPQAQKS